jgi:hypothetical protein
MTNTRGNYWLTLGYLNYSSTALWLSKLELLVASSKVVLQNLAMIEGERVRQIIPWKGPCFRCVIGSSRFLVRSADENHRNGMPTWIARRIGINMELTFELDVKGGFFEGFSPSRLFHGFSDVDESSRQCPTVGRILAANENKISPLTRFDDHIDRQFRLAIFHCTDSP